jgi:hypothetical protein
MNATACLPSKLFFTRQRALGWWLQLTRALCADGGDGYGEPLNSRAAPSGFAAAGRQARAAAFATPHREADGEQRTVSLGRLALYFDVLLAIIVEPLQSLRIFKPINTCWILTLPRTPRLAHLVHQPFAGIIFAVCCL